MASRRIGGRQQIKTAITFHTAGQQILWPYGYTKTDVPGDMNAEDHAALVALGKKMAATNGYTAMQSSSLYVTDGDEIDWAYGHERIFMYTVRAVSEPQPGQLGRRGSTRPTSRSAPQTERNKDAILMLIEAAGCPYAVIGKATPGLRAAVRRLRDLRRLDDEPARDRHGHGRRLAARQPGRHEPPGRAPRRRARRRW